MKKIIAAFIVIGMLAVMVSPVFAQGLIRLDPHGSYYGQPIMLLSPATFNVSMQSQGPAYEPHIFLVMTEDSYNGLTDPVTVGWPGDQLEIPKGDWRMETDNSVKVPPNTTEGAGYTVASLKDHLNTSGPIYWAFGSFLSGPITTTPQQFNVTLPSTNPRMLVYVLGKSEEGAAEFNLFVPPTQPGFVVPELGPMVLAMASFAAFTIYALKRRKV